MTVTVGSHAVSPFVGPFGEQPPHAIADTVRGNDNVLRTITNAHDADETLHVQQSALADRPAHGTAGRIWLATDTGSVRWYLDTGTSWVVIDTPWHDIQIIATSLTISITRANTIVLVDTTAGSVTVTLPAASTLTGRTIIVKKLVAANTLTVEGNASETIDGALNLSWTTQYQSYTLISDATNIYIV